MNDRLHLLISQIQQIPQGSLPRQQKIAELIDYILRGRRVARTQPGRLLSGIYLEIFEAAQVHLQQTIDQSIDSYDFTRFSAQEWIESLRTETYQTVLDRFRLQQLALVVQEHPPRTTAWQLAMQELIQAIRLSSKLSRLGYLSSDLYNEALSKALERVCKEIGSYDPQKGDFMKWVNFRFDMSAREVMRQQDFYVPSNRAKQIRDNIAQQRRVSDAEILETIPSPEATPLLSEQLKEYLEADPQGLLRQRQMRDHPNVTLYKIVIGRLRNPPISWEEMSMMYETGISTLSNFYRRSLEQLAPIIRKAIQDEL